MGGQFKTCSKCLKLTYSNLLGKGSNSEACPLCKIGSLYPLPAALDQTTARRPPPAYVFPKATHQLAEIDQDLSGSIYVYLKTEEHVSTWVNGGVNVPIGLASDYKDNELKRNKTPDENLIHESDIDVNALRAIGFDIVGYAKNLTFSNNVGQLGPIEDVRNLSMKYYIEDGRVMCFSRTLSREIADFLNRKFCVRIDDIPGLKKILDEQVGAESKAGKCRYTDDFQRNPFLKANDQAFMDEFRIYWPTLVDAKTFSLSTGVGIDVSIPDSATT